MGEKIQNTIADLRKNKPQYFEQYESELDKLEEFRLVRNDMAHNRMEFPETNNNQLMPIHYVDLDNGVERFFYRDYTMNYLQDFVIRCRASNLVFARLVQSLRDDFVRNQEEPPTN